MKKIFSFQKNLVESSMDGILGCNENGQTVIFNRSMEQMLDLSKEDVLGKLTLDQLFPQEEEKRFKEELDGERFGGHNRLLLYETALKDRSGRKIPVQVSATVLLEQNKDKGLVCFFIDLREIHRLEREFADQTRILHLDILYFIPAVTSIVNLTDKSLSLSPELLYRPKTNLECRLRGTILVGDKHTEYGEKLNDYKIKLRVRYFF